MISSAPSAHDEQQQQQQQQQQQDELLRGARANVGLLADGIWAPLDRDDSYRKLNRTLWIRNYKIDAAYGELTAGARPKKKRVRDVIPESRLASYGNFEYDDAELLLFREPEDEDNNSITSGGNNYNNNNNNNNVDGNEDEDEEDEEENEGVDNREKRTTNGDGISARKNETKEPWMLDEVEQYVAWIAAATKRPRPASESLLKSDETLKDSQKTSNHITSTQEETSKATMEPPPPPRFSVTNVSEAQLEGRIFSEAVRNLWRTTTSPGPTASQRQQQQQQQQQEQLARGLQRELGWLRPQQPPKRAGTPSSSSSNSDIQQTHCSFQNERLRMPSRCQYSYVQTINMMHRPLAPLCVDVPEFFPKGPGTNWPADDSAKQLQFYPPTPDNPYQDELFPYKGHVAGRKTVTVYQNTLVPIVPTPIVSAVVWPPQAWTQRMLPTPVQIHQMQASNCPTITASPQPMAMQQQPSAPPAMCPTVVHRPIRIQETTVKSTMQQQQQQQQQQQVSTAGHKGPAPIPVYQRPSKITPEYPQRRKSQGVDFNNLILLTKSAMKVRRNQTKGSRKSFAESMKLQSRSEVAKAEGSSTRWFEKGCQLPQKREREYVTVSTTTPSACSRSDTGRSLKDLDSVETSGDGSGSYRDRSTRASQEDLAAEPGTTTASRKRLYSDVLENSGSSVAEGGGGTGVGQGASCCSIDDSSFEKRYDELERQAMEQYRTSEECLALRYQELEQQAMEQYRNAESSESINVQDENHSASPRNDDQGSKINVIGSPDIEPDSRECSSGFGKCNPTKKVPVDDEKGNELQRIKLLKPESKAAAVVHRAASEGSLRPIAVAKRLVAITSGNHHSSSGAGAGSGFGRESKNTHRGASEKIVKTSSLSSLKRRLMPMSPLDRNKSGASLMKNASLDPMKAVQTLDKHVAAYYRNTKVIQTGSGDDKTNNAGVWLSDFWS